MGKACVAFLIIGELRGFIEHGTWKTVQNHAFSPLAHFAGCVHSFACLAPGEVVPPIVIHKLSVVATTQSDHAGREARCAETALEWEQRSGGNGSDVVAARPDLVWHDLGPRTTFAFFVKARPDLVWHRPWTPELHVFADAISARARMLYAGAAPLNDDWVSWSSCDCAGVTDRDARCIVVDDQWAVVPRALVRGYFGIADDPRAETAAPLNGARNSSDGGQVIGPAAAHAAEADTAATRFRFNLGDDASLGQCPCMSAKFAEARFTRRLVAAQLPVVVAPFPFRVDPDYGRKEYRGFRVDHHKGNFTCSSKTSPVPHEPPPKEAEQQQEREPSSKEPSHFCGGTHACYVIGDALQENKYPGKMPTLASRFPDSLVANYFRAWARIHPGKFNQDKVRDACNADTQTCKQRTCELLKQVTDNFCPALVGVRGGLRPTEAAMHLRAGDVALNWRSHDRPNVSDATPARRRQLGNYAAKIFIHPDHYLAAGATLRRANITSVRVLAELQDDFVEEVMRHLEAQGLSVRFDGRTPDYDFCVLSHATHLVSAAGGFSRLATSINANSKLVFEKATGRWQWQTEGFPSCCLAAGS